MYKNLFKLDGKTAIITGGAGLLGQEFSSALADFGANVVVVDINKKNVDKFVKELQKKSWTNFNFDSKKISSKLDNYRQELFIKN